MSALDPAVVAEFAAAVRPDQLISELEQLRTYDCDGLTRQRVTPALVLVPESTAEVQAIVRVCNCARGSRSSPAAPARACPAARCRWPRGS